MDVLEIEKPLRRGKGEQMNLKKITLEKEGEKQAQELVAKLYSVCAGEPLPVVFIALAAVKIAVQGCSKVMTTGEAEELTKRWSEGGQACQSDNP